MSKRFNLRPLIWAAALSAALIVMTWAILQFNINSAASQQALQRTSEPSYVRVLTNSYSTIPLVTVGEEIPLLSGEFAAYTVTTRPFAMSGIPDGLGLYETDDAYYVFVNHEIPAGFVTYLANEGEERIDGARVSLLQFTKDWQLVGGKNLIETAVFEGITYTLNVTTGHYIDSNGLILNNGLHNNLSRFCSGSLATEGFVDANGQPIPIWFAPEESGETGRGWAVSADGTAVALHGLGQYSKEQVLSASQYRAGNPSGRTVLFSTEDTPDSELYMYIGTQTVADPNGFAEGQLYVLRVEDDLGTPFIYETLPEDTIFTGQWVTVPMTIALGTGLELSNWVNAADRSTNFRRLEDIHEDPQNPGTFYFVTTGATTIPISATVPDNDSGRLYRMVLDVADPSAPATVEMVWQGGPDTGVSYDNIVVDHHGHVLIQEDRTAAGITIMAEQQRYARVLSYDIATDSATFLFEANQAAITPEFASDYGNWETTGIIEVEPEAFDGRSSYLMSIQAHTIPNVRYLQGGQLILTTPVIPKLYLPLTSIVIEE